MKTRTMYMHTLEGAPATFSPRDGQIVTADILPQWADRPFPVRLRATVKQVEKDQMVSVANRIKWGFTRKQDAAAALNRYGYVVVKVPA